MRKKLHISVPTRHMYPVMIEPLESRRLMSASVLPRGYLHGDHSISVSTPNVTAPPAPKGHKVHVTHPRPKRAPKTRVTKGPPLKTPPPPAPAPLNSPPVTKDPSLTPPVAGNWQMSYQDEFNSNRLAPEWRTTQYWDETATVYGKGELQAYDASGVSVGNGQLHLTARADNQYGVPYVSGLVMTGGDKYHPTSRKFSFQYGYMEVRAKIPAGQGYWPAIWMMPASYQDSHGEIDVMEVLGGDTKTAYFTIHRLGNQTQSTITGADLSASFHTYGVNWQADRVTWYLDGVAVATTRDSSLIPKEAMYPIMNVAVGGTWGGPPAPTTPFPSTMDVDYIRVWQSPGAVNTLPPPVTVG